MENLRNTIDVKLVGNKKNLGNPNQATQCHTKYLTMI